MTESTAVTIGDISKAWHIIHPDDAGDPITLDANYTCQMTLTDCHGTALVTQAVTEKVQATPTAAADTAFRVYLTELQTVTLQHRHRYVLAVELTNLTLPKPLKTEQHVIIEAVAGKV